jgi:biotin operon repressor
MQRDIYPSDCLKSRQENTSKPKNFTLCQGAKDASTKVCQQGPWFPLPQRIMYDPTETSKRRVQTCILYTNGDWTMQQMADELNLALSTVNRAIQRLKADGMIAVRKVKTAAHRWKQNVYQIISLVPQKIVSMAHVLGGKPKPQADKPVDPAAKLAEAAAEYDRDEHTPGASLSFEQDRITPNRTKNINNNIGEAVDKPTPKKGRPTPKAPQNRKDKPKRSGRSSEPVSNEQVRAQLDILLSDNHIKMPREKRDELIARLKDPDLFGLDNAAIWQLFRAMRSDPGTGQLLRRARYASERYQILRDPWIRRCLALFSRARLMDLPTIMGRYRALTRDKDPEAIDLSQSELDLLKRAYALA